MITPSNRVYFNGYVTKVLESYKKFMRIDRIPQIHFEPVEISISQTHKQGYGAPTIHFYDYETDKHTLKLWKDIYQPNLNADYHVFHELTHACDIDKYARGDKFGYIALRGYLEYHAAQVDILKLLGADSIDHAISFSLTDTVKTIGGQKSLINYLSDIQATLFSLISKPKFPDNAEALSTGLGMVFNHLGRISICRMYSNDYDHYRESLESMDIAKEFIGDRFTLICDITDGFLSTDQVASLNKIYLPTIFELAKQLKEFRQ